MEKLYKFYWSCGRNGSVSGMFIADPKVVEQSIGQHVHFGDILGKFSDVGGTLDREDLTEVDAPEVVVQWLKENLSTPSSDLWHAVPSWAVSGHNPLMHLPEKEDTEDDTSSQTQP